MGGRGSTSGMSGGKSLHSLEVKRAEVSDKARAAFKQKMKARRTGDQELYNKSEKEYRKLSNQRKALDKQIESKRPKSQGSHTVDPDVREKWAQTSTITYERARKRRISQFDAWFFGSDGKR